MIQPIMKDVMFLKQKALIATEADKQVVQDLLDTLKAHEEHCVGLAANMIGSRKRIIAVNIGFTNMAMINPVIVKKSGAYTTQESCLSLIGSRPAKRYQDIEVEYLDVNFKKQKQKFSGWTAQIIQHEVDHCEGIII
ncbi:MAG: peptide deformylase [Clostridium sp.]|nr:peptide deformylase [Clostridium sp.]